MLVGDPDDDPADVGAVLDARCGGLEDDGPADLVGGGDHLGEGGGVAHLGGGDAVVGEQAAELTRGQRSGIAQPASPASLALDVDGEVELVGRGSGGAVEQVAERQQPGAEALEDGHAEEPEPFGGGVVDGAGQAGEHDHRRVGRGHDVLDGVRVGDVAVVLRHQVDRQRGDADGRVGGDGGEAVTEQRAGVGAAAPHVERVAGLESLVETCGQGRARRGREGRERHAEGVREVGHQAALGAGVVHRRDAATRDRSTTGGEHGQGVAELGEVADQVGGDVVGQRLPGRRTRRPRRPSARPPATSRAGSRRRAAGRPRCRPPRAARSPARSRGPSRTVSSTRPSTRVSAARPRARRRRRRRDQLLAGRDGQVEAQPRPGVEQGREHRPGVGDHRHRPGGQVGRSV